MTSCLAGGIAAAAPGLLKQTLSLSAAFPLAAAILLVGAFFSKNPKRRRLHDIDYHWTTRGYAMRLLFLSTVLPVLSIGAAYGANSLVAVEHGVRYQLQSCRNNGPSLFCQLNLTSLHPDEYRALWYASKSFAIDQAGKRMTANDVHAESVAPQDGEIRLPGTRTILTIKFDQVEKSAKMLSDLEIVGDDGSPIKLKFTNVEVAAK